jgi:Uma2 family endonuclease
MAAAGRFGEREDLITGAELARMPDHDLCELVDGRILPMSPTSPEHGRIEANLAAALHTIVRTKNLGIVMTGEVGIFTAGNPDRVRGADVAFISHAQYERRTKARGFLDVAPELVAEILSPEHRHIDMNQKVQEYLAIGVRIVLVVDPVARTITAHRRNGLAQSYGVNDAVPCDDAVGGLVLAVSAVFE